MSNETEDFLAHHGVKGMKWGRRRSQAQLDSASGRSSGGSSSSTESSGSGSEGSPKRKLSPETKRKLAIGAGIVGAAAVVAVGAYAANKHIDANKLKTLGEMRKQVETRRAGEAAARAQLQSYKGQAKWKLSTHSKANREGKKAAAAEVSRIDARNEARRQEFLKRTGRDKKVDKDVLNRLAKLKVELDQPISKQSKAKQAQERDDFKRLNEARARATETKKMSRKDRQLAETRKTIDNFAKKSMWELANELPAKSSKKTISYSPKDSKKDVKLYGDAGAARIRKNVEKGMLLSEARQKEAMKAYGGTALKVALNMRSAQKRESKLFDQLRRG